MFYSTFLLKPIAPVLIFPAGHWEGNVTASPPIPLVYWHLYYWLHNLNVHFWDKTFPNRVDWNGANTFCRGAGMTLVSLDTQEEDQMISNHITGVSNPGEN